LSYKSSHLPTIASHIVSLLKTPDILFLQEIQDDSGPTNNGTVSANLTLSTLTKTIASLSNVTYSFAVIDPVNNQDGGVGGGNIRVAYLYRPEVIELIAGPAGNATQAVAVEGPSGAPKLRYVLRTVPQD